MRLFARFSKRRQKIATAQSLARYLAIFYSARIDRIEQSLPEVAIQLKQANQSMNFAQLREQDFSQYSQAELDNFIQTASECKHLLQKRL